MLTIAQNFTQHVAYIDGGTGSFLIQALIAGVVSAGFILKQRWATIRTMISGRKVGRS